jgi:hypothetical protein
MQRSRTKAANSSSWLMQYNAFSSSITCGGRQVHQVVLRVVRLRVPTENRSSNLPPMIENSLQIVTFMVSTHSHSSVQW